MAMMRYIIGLGLLVSIAAVQGLHDRFYPRAVSPEFHYIPQGSVIRLTMPHVAQTVSDMYWIKSILYFGRRIEETGTEGIGINLARSIRRDTSNAALLIREEYRMLADMLKTVVELDPYFKYPYLFGGLFLSMAGGLVDDSIEFLRRGARQFPDDWRFPFYLGFNHYFFRNDPVLALQEFVRAAVVPGRPAYVYSVIQSVAQKESRQDVAETFLEGAVLSGENQQMRKDLEELLRRLREGGGNGDANRR